jgi:hypothetical protein
MRITNSLSLVAWYCDMCGRMEGAAEERECPDCGSRRHRVSRYEWFLADALERELATTGRDFVIIEQWELPDHRGFSWFFDLAVLVGGITDLIEIQGPLHARQKTYSGKGGGYTRDEDKRWEVFSVRELHKQGFDLREINSDDCRLVVVAATAKQLTKEILHRADHWR